VNGNRIRIASIDQTPIPVWILLNDVAYLDDPEHVSHTDPVFESLGERMVRDKKVASSNKCSNGIDVHDDAE